MNGQPIQLDVIDIASPCSADWDRMQGTDRVRFCDQCRLHVYNLSEMHRSEAEDLVIQHEGRLCVRFYRRRDGTLLTRDCPVGLWAARRRVARMVAGIAALVGFIVLGGWWSRSGWGRTAQAPNQPDPITRCLAYLQGDKRAAAPRWRSFDPLARLAEWIEPPPEPLMGDVALGSMCPAPPLPAPPSPASDQLSEPSAEGAAVD